MGIYQPIFKLNGGEIHLFKPEAAQKIELIPGQKETVRVMEASTELMLLMLQFYESSEVEEEFVISVDGLSITVTFTKP